jgi:hypothetical protein
MGGLSVLGGLEQSEDGLELGGVIQSCCEVSLYGAWRRVPFVMSLFLNYFR